MSSNIEEAKRIIKSNTNRNNYTKSCFLRICDDELSRLTEMLSLISDEIKEQELTTDKCIEHLQLNIENITQEQSDEIEKFHNTVKCHLFDDSETTIQRLAI